MSLLMRALIRLPMSLGLLIVATACGSPASDETALPTEVRRSGGDAVTAPSPTPGASVDSSGSAGPSPYSLTLYVVGNADRLVPWGSARFIPSTLVQQQSSPDHLVIWEIVESVGEPPFDPDSWVLVPSSHIARRLGFGDGDSSRRIVDLIARDTAGVSVQWWAHTTRGVAIAGTDSWGFSVLFAWNPRVDSLPVGSGPNGAAAMRLLKDLDTAASSDDFAPGSLISLEQVESPAPK